MRTTNQQTQLAKGFPIVLEVSHMGANKVDLLYSLVEIWLRKNCKNLWTLEEIEEYKHEDQTKHVYIRIVFQDPREAMFYKLSPSFLHSRVTIPLMFYYIGKM